ncbi:16S rRNA (cytosine(1402)-N(4))-methyltransferase RsmH [Nocardioides sp. 1609]|uniref:16S rRNA (cytosine(1402)-N(4))-methyltransferase RsmH n=1 Tax=Nocardioides sp. 1609 TaxID=2508327 RepID=UPI00106F2337|nr:16S rRNA (cytosine(1402)-N(4))-methyltransferase RsmH [Nocardioides sp. 1609]
MNRPQHDPVLLDRVVDLLRPALDREGAAGGPTVLVDATLGLGGHTEAVLARCPLARVVGIDRDPDALALAGARLAPYGDRFTGVHATYDEIPDVVADLGLDRRGRTDGGVDGVLFDLGVSSMQLDVAERGFAYAVDAPLDMRMDGTGRSGGPTAADVLNTYSAAELTRVLRDYGEEKFARKIAGAIVRQRESAPFVTSAALVELLYAEIPAPARRTGGHPAKRTFQALRMEVNDELAVLRRALPAAIEALTVGGRVVVEAYHSLEDRLVKQAFVAVTRSEVPPDLPFVPEGSEPAFRLVTRGAEKADAGEIDANPRAASVRLRAVERTRPSNPRDPWNGKAHR